MHAPEYWLPRTDTDDPVRNILAPGTEKLLHYIRAPAGENASTDLNLMVETGVVQHAHHGVDSTSFGVVRTENQSPNARLHKRTGTHRTRFNCSKQV